MKDDKIDFGLVGMFDLTRLINERGSDLLLVYLLIIVIMIITLLHDYDDAVWCNNHHKLIYQPCRFNE
jgi:hypothetical protein